jgi:Zn ribbon nucleic-acid-binding protein
MGSVSYTVTCPQCGNEDAYGETYYKQYEDYVFCEKCGYSETIKPKFDRQLSNGDTKYYLKNKNGKLIFNRTIRKGYGTYSIYPPGGGIGRLGKLPSNEDKRLEVINELRHLKRQGNTVKVMTTESGILKELVL